MKKTDYDLVKGLQKGDVDDFDILYERYSGRLYFFCMKYLRSHEDSEDLVQSVFLKIWGNRKGLLKECSFKSYIFTITINDIRKTFRKRSYEKRFINEILLDKSLETLTFEESIDYQSVLQRIQEIIKNLPERQKVIFEMSRFEGKSTKVIAKELNLAPGTVDNYISEVLKIIRKKVQKEEMQ